MATGSVENIIKEMIREASESLAEEAADHSEVVQRLLAKYRLPELVAKFAGITAGSLVQRLIESAPLPAGVDKKLVASVVNEVITGLSGGVAEAATRAAKEGGADTMPQSGKKNPVIVVSSKGQTFVAICGDVHGLHKAVVQTQDACTLEVVRGLILCPRVQAVKARWELEHHTGSFQKPYPVKFVLYEYAREMVSDPLCPYCKASENLEEDFQRANEEKEKEKSKKYKPLTREGWCQEIGPEGMWLATALAGSTSLKQSDFIDEMANVPPTAWRTLTRHIAISIVNRARQNKGRIAIMRYNEPVPQEFFGQPDMIILDHEDVKYCTQFLSGFGVTRLKLPTKVERVFDRIGDNIPTETVKHWMKISLVVFAALGMIGIIALAVLFSQLTP